MNIDQCLEALTQTVELLAHMQQENEKRFDQVTHNMEILHDSIKRLENIALAHEQRLDDIEGE
jgi:peptidoglycan hydrolase CwlO-like protein